MEYERDGHDGCDGESDDTNTEISTVPDFLDDLFPRSLMNAIRDSTATMAAKRTIVRSILRSRLISGRNHERSPMIEQSVVNAVDQVFC